MASYIGSNPFIAGSAGIGGRSFVNGRRADQAFMDSNNIAFANVAPSRPTRMDGVARPTTTVGDYLSPVQRVVRVATAVALYTQLSLLEVCPSIRVPYDKLTVVTHRPVSGIMPSVAENVPAPIVATGSDSETFTLDRYALALGRNIETAGRVEDAPVNKALSDSVRAFVRNTATVIILQGMLNSRKTASAKQYSNVNLSIEEMRDATHRYFKNIGIFQRSPKKARVLISEAKEILGLHGARATHVIVPAGAEFALRANESLEPYSETGRKSDVSKPISTGRGIAGLSVISQGRAGLTRRGTPVDVLSSTIQVASHSIAMPDTDLQLFDFRRGGFVTVNRPARNAQNEAGLPPGDATPTDKLVMVVMRPVVKLRTQSVIVLAGGSGTMVLAFNHPILTEGQDAGMQQAYHQYSVRMGACVYAPENIFVLNDVICRRVLSGASAAEFTNVAKAKTDEEMQELLDTQSAMHGESVLIRYIKKEDFNSFDQVVDLVGMGGSGFTGQVEKDLEWAQQNHLGEVSMRPRANGYNTSEVAFYTASVLSECRVKPSSAAADAWTVHSGIGPVSSELFNSMRM